MFVPEGKGLKARSKKLADKHAAVSEARRRVLAQNAAIKMARIASAAK